MTHRKRVLLIGVYAILPAALIVLMLLGWMLSAEKATVILQAANSTDGLYRAEVVRADPGVSSSYEYVVRLMPANVLICETRPGRVSFRSAIWMRRRVEAAMIRVRKNAMRQIVSR